VKRMRLRAWLVAAALLYSQTPAAQTPTFRSGVELVEVAVLVRDRDGRFVPDLTQADFEIVEQGAAQKIVAFDRVALPIVQPAADRARELTVARDVSSNERVADSRIFVLVLDALHVDSRRTRELRRFARQFIERHVGEADLVAVVSPGGLESATQDFTSDKARLLAAVDQFTGTKLRSAAIGIEEERRAVDRGSVAVHDGKDPDDYERAGRAASLTNVLEALAKHLERAPRRRKSLLLFSEGIEYNQLDILGVQQRYASDVMKAMSRAVGALMRANVSLYAIDPRGLSSVEGDLGETQAFGVARGHGGSLSASVDEEYADSIRSLRHVSEATGGFAAVDTNSFSGAFDRIIEDSSNYYVLGYTPSSPMKPGEFREISVRVSRAGVNVVARKGHAAPRAQSRAAPSELASEAAPSPFAATRPRGRPIDLVPTDMAAPVRTTRGLANDLQTLLASPLPRAGLPMRVQAIPFGGDAKKGTVQLVVEVLGGALQFGARGGRFEERIDLAMLTVDARGKADNGRSTTIELRLSQEELQRVKTTGVRWLSRLDLAPGQYQVRVAGRATRTAATGLVTTDVEVPRLRPDRPALSGVTLTSMTSVLMLTKGDSMPGTALTTPPSAARTFVAGDLLTAVVDVYVPPAIPELELVAAVEWSDGSRNPPLKKKIGGGQAQSRSEEVAIPIDTSLLAPGRYVLRIALDAAAAGADKAERLLRFDITTASGR